MSIKNDMNTMDEVLVAFIQVIFVIAMFVTYPLWRPVVFVVQRVKKGRAA